MAFYDETGAEWTAQSQQNYKSLFNSLPYCTELKVTRHWSLKQEK